MRQSSHSRSGAAVGVALALTLFAAPSLGAQAFNSGYFGNCSGNVGAITNADASCGVAGANGVVSTSGIAGSTQYGWISTRGGTTSSSVQLPGVQPISSPLRNAPTNGTTWSYQFFAGAGTSISFRFNYVTSDGVGYEDFGYAKINDDLLLTARSSPNAPAVPGAGMPASNLPTGTAAGTINANQTTWAALGQWSNTCWAAGCGFTGWLSAQYTLPTEGYYTLTFGVVNLNDQLWDTGMAFDFDLNVANNTVPNPVGPTNPPVPVIDDISSSCSEVEVETEEEDGVITEWTKIHEGSCEGDETEYDQSYTPTQVSTFGVNSYVPEPPVTVPEPRTAGLVMAGMAMLLVVARRKR